MRALPTGESHLRVLSVRVSIILSLLPSENRRGNADENRQREHDEQDDVGGVVRVLVCRRRIRH